MAEETSTSGAVAEAQAPDEAETKCESPPVAEAPPRSEPDPRARLHALAEELVRTRNRRLIFEYLRLRRTVR